MNWVIHRFTTVDSTMRLAAPMPIGSVVIAEEQTDGIGRHGHNWDSQRNDGLYASVVLAPGPVLTLALGLAAAEAVTRVTALVCDIRWPNDLMLHERKFGGILVQMQDERAVAGIGINVGQRRFAPDLRSIATSLLLETDLQFRAEDILNALLPAIDYFTAKKAPEVIGLWERASSWARGKPVSVEMGSHTITGVTAGLDPAGFLRVRRFDGRIEIVLAGGVRPLSAS